MDKQEFRPRRVASWWTSIDDLMYPEKTVADRIKRRAARCAEARVDLAINFGFHIRYDFSNYFGQLHAYLNRVAEELHGYGIRYFDHFSCNTIERPRGAREQDLLHKRQRHHVLLYHDAYSAPYAQYDGHRFNDLREVDTRTGGPAYSDTYKLELFCHNNPEYLEMNMGYLRRLVAEVDFDGAQIDDMCDYAGLASCTCPHCRDRFLREYGHVLPPLEDASFWGDTTKHVLEWGNYENPVFRDWIEMRFNSVTDHVAKIKQAMGGRLLMTCCSSTGPITLNSIALNLERMTPHLDVLMLENCGFSVDSTDWVDMDAEALQQKDIAAKMGNAPAMACSYSIFQPGAYLGWALGRFWGVANWCSTLHGRLEEDPKDPQESQDLVAPYNNWEAKHSDLDPNTGRDVAEVRLVNSRFCKENGFRTRPGEETWQRVAAWSRRMVENNVGYRFVRAEELADAAALCAENTPLLLDGIGCVSDTQYEAVCACLERGGKAWIRAPFGTHDEKGFPRGESLMEGLANNAGRYPGLTFIEADSWEDLMDEADFSPLVRAEKEMGFAVRLRGYGEAPAIHLMNRDLQALPHAAIRDMRGVAILAGMEAKRPAGEMQMDVAWPMIARAGDLKLHSPELEHPRPVSVEKLADGGARLRFDITGVSVYAVIG